MSTETNQDTADVVETPETLTPSSADDALNVNLQHKSVIEGPAPASAPKIKVDIPQILEISCNALSKVILQAPKGKSKMMFKRLKAGESFKLGDLNTDANHKIQLKLKLDHKHFEGPGFNNDVFRASVDQLMKNIVPRLLAKQELNVRSDEKGQFLFDIPAGIRIKDQLNVMMLILDLREVNTVEICLSYFDPSQFRLKE